MPNTPIPTLTQFAVENDTTGQVDYLKFQGSTLVQSKLVDYGLGTEWHIVGDLSATELLAQNTVTGLTDLLVLDGNGALTGSSLGNVSLPQIVASGDFTGSLFNPLNPFTGMRSFVSQLPDGELDILRFDAQTGVLVKSDLVPNTAGLAPAIGAGGATAPLAPGAFNKFPALNQLGVINDNVFLQLPDGQVDAVGFDGSLENASLSVSSSLLFPGAYPKIEAVSHLDIEQLVQVPFTEMSVIQSAAVQMVSQLADGSFDLLFFDAGFNGTNRLDVQGRGTFYASQQLNLSMPGWHVVDANQVTGSVFRPIS